MKKKKFKLPSNKIYTIVVSTVVSILVIGTIILNCFLPVKYIASYLVKHEPLSGGKASVTFLNVGYGDCTLIRLPDGKNVLIDGGDGSYENNLKVFKLLNKNGVKKVNYMFCTSVYNEHCGGLADVALYKEVETAYIPYCANTDIRNGYRTFINALEKKNIDTKYCGIGQEVLGDNYKIKVLSPTDKDSPDSEYAHLNDKNNNENIRNASIVLWFECFGTNIVFASDAGHDALEKICDYYELALNLSMPYIADLSKCDIVTVSGHGLDVCSSARWYNTLNADKAILSVGKNYSDCPSAIALGDVRSVDTDVIFTSRKGDVKIEITESGYTVL